MSTWAVVPAYNEADRIGGTIKGLQHHVTEQVLVVDDGSWDETYQRAKQSGVEVVRLPQNRGKGRAVTLGIDHVLKKPETSVIVLADADLGESAGDLAELVRTVQEGRADMAIADFRSPGGFGLARRLASRGIMYLTGFKPNSPLSGQRALSRYAAERLFPYTPGWGLEVGMTVRALWSDLNVLEVPLCLSHRATRRDWAGFWHRGRQCAAIASTLCRLAFSGMALRPSGGGRR